MASPGVGAGGNGITAKTGSAKLEKLGHTSGNQFAQNPHVANTKRQAPRDESAK